MASNHNWESTPPRHTHIRASFIQQDYQWSFSVAEALGLEKWNPEKDEELSTMEHEPEYLQRQREPEGLSLCLHGGHPTPTSYPKLSQIDGPMERWPSVIDRRRNVLVDLNLPPVDGGRRAWLFMLGAFMVEGLLWGFPLTFGVFQSYYQVNPPFENTKYLPVVGTLCTGISYLGTPLLAPLTIKYPIYQPCMIWGGFCTCIIALVVSSFATKLWHLIVTQGLLYGVGFLFIYYPLLSMLNEWFVKRRGFAYGIMFGSAGACGLGLPILIEKLLNKYGYATTLRAYAVAILVLVGPTIPLIRARVPPSKVEKISIDKSVFSRLIFICVSLSNFFQGFGFFLPGIFIPSYAESIGLSPSQGILILSLLNVAQIVGQIAVGYVSDRLSPEIPMIVSAILSCVACIFVWGFFETIGPLAVFSLFYGIVAGGYSVLYARFVTVLTDDRSTGLWLYSIFEFQRGAGNIAGGLVSGWLVKGDVRKGQYGMGRYQNLILVTGGAFLLSAFLGSPAWLFRDKTKEKSEDELVEEAEMDSNP